MMNAKEVFPKTERTPSEAPNELLTKRELAKRLRVSTRKIELDTKLPAIRWARTVRYNWIDVIAYLEGKQDSGE